MMTYAAHAAGVFILVLFFASTPTAGADGGQPGGAPAFKYEDFDSARRCEMCHEEITREWRQSLMAQSFTHEWDEIEYFRLALPQALALEKVAGVKAGCIGCHAPLAYLTGDIPPQPPAAGTRANEGVTCDVCHSITGSSAEVPFNFSYLVESPEVKRGQRKDGKSPLHATEFSEFISSPELCACCHDEQSPYGAWVKTTYREWKAGPYAAEGTRCHDCHMHYAPGAAGAKQRRDVAHHNFHGSHVPGKLAGAVDVAIYASSDTAGLGRELKIQVQLFNGKAGHCVPSGSTEERMLWLEVAARDAAGNVIPLPVDRRGFDGEEYTIADPAAKAYFALGDILGIADFAGLSRDGAVPAGCRIFRRPFFDPEDRMTICQWYTASNEKVDYRIGPRQTRIETYTLTVPENAAPGDMTFSAVLYYSQVPASVAEFLGLPASEAAPIKVNEAALVVDVR